MRHSIFLVPFAPPALTGFIATMRPLTPEAAALRPSGHERRPSHPRSPCFMDRAFRPFRLQPSYVARRSRFGFGSSAYRRALARERTHSGRVPHGVTWASPPYSRLATTTGRIEFVILRTGPSPPVAPHPASRRRSYVRLQSSNPTSAGTSTLLIQPTCKRTVTALRYRLGALVA